MNIDNNINWDALAQSIADGEAVLILGPDAILLYRKLFYLRSYYAAE